MRPEMPGIVFASPETGEAEGLAGDILQ